MKPPNFVILDFSSGAKSGGSYFILRRILRSASKPRIPIRVLGISDHPTLETCNENVNFVPLKRIDNILVRFSRVTSVIPFIDKTFDDLIKSSFQRNPLLKGVDWWFFPHSFYPIHRFGKTIAMCLDLQHYTYPENFPWIIRRIRKAAELSLGQAEKIVCISDFTRNELLNHYPEYEKKATVIYEIPDMDVDPYEIEEEEKIIRDKYPFPFFIYPAVDWRHKNHIFLIKNTKILREKIGPEFLILFTGARRKGSWLRKEIENYHVSQNVKDLGLISRSMLFALYKRSRALLFPSLYEGFGIPLVEAMAMGTPIIASNCASIPEVVEKSAVLFSPNSPEDFIEAVTKIYVQDATYRELSAASQKRGNYFQAINWWDSLIRILD
jgi:glycosyltransferase involved in cell wall biosynthesis